MKNSSRLFAYSLLLLFFVQLAFVSAPKSTSAYSSCVGIEDGDVAIIQYKGTIKSTGEVFDNRPNGISFTIKEGSLIQGFYDEVLGMKIGDRKTFEVPPSKGYTDPKTAPAGLYGETLIFDVYIAAISTGSHACNTAGSSSSGVDTFFKVLGWIVGIGVVGFLGVTGYYGLQKSTTADCVHCKAEGRNRLSEGKCGRCGNTYCRQSFSRGCPNCKSNTFVPNK